MIKTKDGLLKLDGEEVWIARKTREGRRIAVKSLCYHSDPYLRMMDFWHSREACQKECDRLNK